MILNTGQRIDIPAFFPLWLANRIKEGYVFVRNPYNPSLVTRYEINPEVVDAIVFCTKNPKPFFSLSRFGERFRAVLVCHDYSL